MDKETIIDITTSGHVDLGVIYDYCIEKGKEQEKTRELIEALGSIPTVFWKDWYVEAVEYFQRKHGIVIVTDKNNRIIDVY